MHVNHTAANLVLETLPSGEPAWLRPESDDDRYTLTDAGRRALAEERLFGPWPTVAQTAGLKAAVSGLPFASPAKRLKVSQPHE